MTEEQKEVLQAGLKDEKETIRRLKTAYEKALREVEGKICELSAKADMNPENLQSIIWQQKYQNTIRRQLEASLDKLHKTEYETITDYLNSCYENGYLGVMYDIAAQDVPFLFPIDQKAVVNAVQLDSKLSKPMYDRLGEDIKALKISVRSEISSGIASGQYWNQVAARLAANMTNSPANTAYNNAVRIVRTEGHRIQNQAALDAQRKAKDMGADIVKQWDSTLDGKTRSTHRELDGQIKEIDEPFEVAGKKAAAPGGFGDPSEDCNCRCALIQAPRWALDGKVVKMDNFSKEVKTFDSVKDYEDFKEKYWSEENIAYMDYVSEMGQKYHTRDIKKLKDKLTDAEYDCLLEMEGKNPMWREKALRTKRSNGNYGVSWDIVKSKDYSKKFDNISNNPKANALAAKRSKNALVNRDGKNTEELYAISLTTGKDVSSITNQHYKFGVKRTNKFENDVKRAEDNGEKILFIHNHPKGFPPSIDDINELLDHEHAVGITIGHNGSVYYYTKPDEKIKYFDRRIAIRKTSVYNNIDEIVEEENAMMYLAEKFGFLMKKF